MRNYLVTTEFYFFMSQWGGWVLKIPQFCVTRFMDGPYSLHKPDLSPYYKLCFFFFIPHSPTFLIYFSEQVVWMDECVLFVLALVLFRYLIRRMSPLGRSSTAEGISA